MASFVFWREPAGLERTADDLHSLLLSEVHIAPESTFRGGVETTSSRWHFAAFATRTHFYSANQQLWQQPGQGVCVIHGLIWRIVSGQPVLLDAAAVAQLLDDPTTSWPDDIAGEYAVARLQPDGTLTAFSDQAGLHQLFHGPTETPVLANRAGLAAAVLGDRTADRSSLTWLAAIGYRVGTGTAYGAVTQLAQEQVLSFGPQGMTTRRSSAPIVRFEEDRGWSPALDALLAEGIAQAQAAIQLGIAPEGPIDLPITGGKDSRVILALCLASGLKHRLRLFTRGYAGHPDVIAGAGIAAALGLPHRREPPHGSDEPAHWTVERFFHTLMAQTWQTDGMVGGWDLILGERIATETLITGHMGEVLKAYSKKPLPAGGLDPIAMVRLQAPFDPMGILRPEAREALAGQLATQMEQAFGAGALEGDLPDLFYYRNRIPNWLGAIRAIKSFERQPVVPLGAPALLRLAFRMTPEERKIELLHYRIIQHCAPELLALPFALQRWDRQLGPDVPQTDPVLPGAGSPPVFGNWQFSINHNPAIRAALAATIEERSDLALWRSIDRDAVLDRLRNRRLDYFDGISMLGLVVAIFQESAMVEPVKVGGPAVTQRTSVFLRPAVDGCLDGVRTDGDAIIFDGWAHVRAFPAAQLAIEARLARDVLGMTVADRDRPDLVPHGFGDGRHGFSLAVPRERLRAAAAGASAVEIAIMPFDSEYVIGRATVAP